MEFSRLDHHPNLIQQASDLVYETDGGLFKFLFGPKNKALTKIEKLIKTEHTSFSKNYIYISFEDDQLLGLLIGYKGNEIDKEQEETELVQHHGFFNSIIFSLKISLLRPILTMKPQSNDFYISNICVKKETRGKGIGAFLLDQITPIAKEKQCDQLVLDVSLKNKKARQFYERNGFQIKKENSAWYLPKDFRTITLTRQIKKEK